MAEIVVKKVLRTVKITGFNICHIFRNWVYSNQMLRVVQNREEFYIYHFMSNMGLSFFGVVVVGCDCFFIVTRRPDGPVFFL